MFTLILVAGSGTPSSATGKYINSEENGTTENSVLAVVLIPHVVVGTCVSHPYLWGKWLGLQLVCDDGDSMKSRMDFLTNYYQYLLRLERERRASDSERVERRWPSGGPLPNDEARSVAKRSDTSQPQACIRWERKKKIGLSG